VEPKAHLRQPEPPLTCRGFLENAIVPAPLIINSEDTLVFVGTLLSAKDATCAVIRSKEKDTYESIYGYQMVTLLLESKPENLFNQLYTPASKSVGAVPPSPLPTVHLDDEFTKALNLMVENRFGDALVLDDNGEPSGLLSLGNIVAFFAGRTDSIGMSLKEVSSKLKLIDGSKSVIEVFRFMMTNRMRRAVLKRGGGFYCCTEREIMRGIFSFKGLNLIRDNPDEILGMPLERLVSPFLNHIPSLSGSLDVAEGWVQASWNTNCTLIVDEKHIATPWDLVIKPHLSGKLPL